HMNPVIKTYRIPALAGALFVLLASAPAQTPPAATKESPPGPVAAPVETEKELPPVTLETFNVSAVKTQSYQAESVQMGAFRDMNPVDVPLTINVLTREVLDAQDAHTLLDALKNTAGVTQSQLTGSAYNNLAIRGIVIENRGNYRLNGSLPIINLADIAMEDKERVEVLKGTSSLYYGFVPPSGVINLVTKRATPEPITVISLNANSAGGEGSSLDVGRRFGANGQFGLRVNAAASKEDTGIDNYAGHRDFASLAADWRITQKLAIRADVEHLSKNVSEQSAITLPVAINGVVTPPPLPANTQNLGASWMRYDAYMTNWWTRVDYLISQEWTVFFEAGNAETFRNRIYSPFTFTNVTTGAGSLKINFYPRQDYRNSNYRGELFGHYLTGMVRHDISLGFTGNTRRSNAPTQGSVTFAQNYFNPLPVPLKTAPTTVVTPVPTRILDFGTYVTDRMSAYNERIQMIVGVRDTEYISTTATTNYAISGQVQPMFSAAFKPTANSSIYTSYIKGLEAGGNAPLGTTNAGSILPPLTSTQYEVGGKAKLFGGLLLQLGVYQIERPSAFTDPATNTFVPNGLARYRGIEMFTSGELTKTLSLIVSGQILDARQTKALNATTLDKVPEGTPRYTASVFGEWKTPVKNLSASLGVYYIGNRPVNNMDQGYVGGYTSYSAGLGYRIRLHRVLYTVKLNCDNLTNKDAWAAAGAGLLGVNAPRLLKFSLSAGF
ncbi:MAG: TonB-dependent siderophore receptor, partial [Opitutales bacterium]